MAGCHIRFQIYCNRKEIIICALLILLEEKLIVWQLHMALHEVVCADRELIMRTVARQLIIAVIVAVIVKRKMAIQLVTPRIIIPSHLTLLVLLSKNLFNVYNYIR